MLTKCPECDLQVSDKAKTCPHCGYPLTAKTKSRLKTKRRRLPNGFGQISEIKDHNLRKPFRAMITTGKDEHGKPICKLLKPNAYFETYNEAYTALLEYNKDPYDLSKSITVKELYEKWFEEYSKRNVSDSRLRSIKSSWKYCNILYDIPVTDIRVKHIKQVINEGHIIDKNNEKIYPSALSKKLIKMLLTYILDYAVEYEIVDKNYAKLYTMDKDISEEIIINKKNHICFANDEMKILWENKDEPYVDILLIQCYSGWRPQELISIKLSDVNLEEQTFRGGMKTKSGKNRIVPIHSAIIELVEKRYKEAEYLKSENLFNDITCKYHVINYNRFKYKFCQIINKYNLNPEHKPHDGRKHFITEAKKYNVDEYAIKRIVGHSISDITENIYTERDVSWLTEEIEKIKKGM